MDPTNRIDPTALTLSVPRQTPRDEFGVVLSDTVARAVSSGGMMLTGVGTGSPVVSAALAGVTSIQHAVTSGVYSVGTKAPYTVTGGAPSNPPEVGPAREDSLSFIDAQRQQSQEYLAIQNSMQQESREFNALSNVIKVRHDSAKAAINNIR